MTGSGTQFVRMATNCWVCFAPSRHIAHLPAGEVYTLDSQAAALPGNATKLASGSSSVAQGTAGALQIAQARSLYIQNRRFQRNELAPDQTVEIDFDS